jgi:hypothetical protein
MVLEASLSVGFAWEVMAWLGADVCLEEKLECKRKGFVFFFLWKINGSASGKSRR